MSLDGLSNLPFRQRKKNEVLRLHFVLVAGEGFAVALHCHSTDGQTKTGATCRFVGFNPKVAGYMFSFTKTYMSLDGLSNLPFRQRKKKMKSCDFTLFLLRGKDLNLRPSGYEPDELPSCSTPRYVAILQHVQIYVNMFLSKN